MKGAQVIPQTGYPGGIQPFRAVIRPVRFGEDLPKSDKPNPIEAKPVADPLTEKIDSIVKERMREYEKQQRKKGRIRSLLTSAPLAALAAILYFAPADIGSKPYQPQGIDSQGLSADRLAKRPNQNKALEKSFQTTLGPIEAHYQNLANYAKPAVVMIHPDPKHLGSLGSGVIIRSDGLIITNNHVVDSAPQVSGEPTRVLVTLYNGHRVVGRVLGVDKDSDLAVVKIDETNLPTLKLAQSNPTDGTMVMTVGHPLGMGWAVTHGLISGHNRTGQLPGTTMLQTDAEINPGNSGGPMITMKGEVVGLNQSVLYQTLGATYTSFTVPVETINRLLPKLTGEGVP